MTEENRLHNLAREWELGETAWREGELLLNGGEPRGALTRFYYAAFHAACAALLTLGVEATTHAGVRSQLSAHFIRTGCLPADLARLLAGLQQLREDADYERDVEIDADQARGARQDANRIRQTIGSWLRENDWLRASP
ncbi:HEPN domain-containing protein [bacterium CPR1]|nr:HEPN domain-containing protein [bacterium CPR1]